MAYHPKHTRIKSDRERDRSRTFRAKASTRQRKSERAAKHAARQVSR